MLTASPLGLENLTLAPAPDILVHLVHLVVSPVVHLLVLPVVSPVVHLLVLLPVLPVVSPVVHLLAHLVVNLARTQEVLKQAHKQAPPLGPPLGLVQTALKEVLRPVLKPVLPQVLRRAQVQAALKPGLKQELLPARPPELARDKLALRQERAPGPLLGQDLAQRRSQEQTRRQMLELEPRSRPTRTTTRHLLRHRRPRVSHSLPPA